MHAGPGDGGGFSAPPVCGWCLGKRLFGVCVVEKILWIEGRAVGHSQNTDRFRKVRRVGERLLRESAVGVAARLGQHPLRRELRLVRFLVFRGHQTQQSVRVIDFLQLLMHMEHRRSDAIGH